MMYNTLSSWNEITFIKFV